MNRHLETVDVNTSRIEANLSINLTENPNVFLPKTAPDKIEKFCSDWSGETYALNLARLACSCPDFVKWRHSFSQSDPRRICKHLKQKLFQRGFYNSQDDLCKAIIDAGWKAEELHTFQVNGKSRIAIMYGTSEWINVYVRNRRPSDSYGEYSGKFNDYGLSRAGDYWSYGRSPPGTIMIKSLLSYNGII